MWSKKTLEFEKKLFWNSILGFTDNEYSMRNHMSGKFFLLLELINFKNCACFNGKIVNANSQSILYFELD